MFLYQFNGANRYLWLVDAGQETKANFLLMAKKAGVASSRVIFGERADFDAHIQVCRVTCCGVLFVLGFALF